MRPTLRNVISEKGLLLLVVSRVGWSAGQRRGEAHHEWGEFQSWDFSNMVRCYLCGFEGGFWTTNFWFYNYIHRQSCGCNQKRYPPVCTLNTVRLVWLSCGFRLVGQRGSCPTRGLASAPPRYPPRQVRSKISSKTGEAQSLEVLINITSSVNRNDWYNIFVCLVSVEWMLPTHASSNVVHCTKSHMCMSHFKAKFNCHRKLAFCHKVG